MTNATFVVGQKVIRLFGNSQMAAGSVWTVSWVASSGSLIRLAEQADKISWNAARFKAAFTDEVKPSPKFKPGDVVIRTKPYLYMPDAMPVGSTWIVDSYEYEDGDGILRLVGKTGGWTASSYELAGGFVASAPAVAPAPVKRVVYNSPKSINQKVTAYEF